MIKGWGDGKRFLAEDIIVYTVVLLLDLAWDWGVNLACATRLIQIPHELNGHPYSWGVLQIALACFCMVQLARKLNQWKYYS